MFPRDLLASAPAQTVYGFNRGVRGIASADCDNGSDELMVQRILTAASQHRPRTMGEFGHFARPYLNAGYQREVAEAHRRYFSGSQN